MQICTIEVVQRSGGSVDVKRKLRTNRMPRSAEQRLWQQALIAIVGELHSSQEQTLRERFFARRWTGQYPSQDLRMVGDLADLDAD